MKEFISNERGVHEEDFESIIGVDDGKNMLKITWNFVDKSEQELALECEHCQKIFTDQYKQRDHMTNDHQENEDAGARKSILLFASQGTEENHSNLAVAIEEINLDKIDYKLCLEYLLLINTIV